MKTGLQSLRCASILAPMLLAGSLMPLSANMVTVDLGSIWATYDSDSDASRGMSPTSVTVTPEGFYVAINRGTNLFNTESSTENLIDAALNDPGLWLPTWHPLANDASGADGSPGTPEGKILGFEKILDNEGAPSIPAGLPSAVPEPSSAAGLLAIGVGLLAARRARVRASDRV
jgi:hypothetical protein